MDSEIMFIFMYILFVICVVHPPFEVVSAGFTISELFESVLGNENIEFIQYNIRRTILTMFIYSQLPALFGIGLHCFFEEETAGLLKLLNAHPFIYLVLITIAIGIQLMGAIQCYIYYKNMLNHPIVNTLTKFANANISWEQVAESINNEYRRVDKICLKTTSITTVIATEHWIIKVTPLHVYITHQSDTELTVADSDTHSFSYETPGTAQYLTIEVKSSRVPNFRIRLNALDFQDLQDRIVGRINILPEVKFHRSVTEKFTDAFKDAIKDNVKYEYTHELELCIGCMQNRSNLKLQKYCIDKPGEESCTSCYCRPMWCIDCLANWFAHRQDQNAPSTWLSSKCTCPTCRATFCVVDVCPIHIE